MPVRSKRPRSRRLKSLSPPRLVAVVAVLALVAAVAALYRWERAKLARLAYQKRLVLLTFPEGFNRFDIAQRLEHFGVCPKAEFLAATSDPQLLAQLSIAAATAEGYLFPDTYEFLKQSHAAAVVQRLAERWNSRVTPLLAQYQASLTTLHADLNWGPHEVITLASIVEKEATRPEEQPVIAGVFLNRLRSEHFKPKFLQADPTLSYGCLMAPETTSCRDFDNTSPGRTQRMDRHNPYNTYHVEGLPPGPIANPGLNAIRAVLQPARHDFYYFVAKGDGSHHFSRSFEEHRRAIARYLKTTRSPAPLP